MHNVQGIRLQRVYNRYLRLEMSKNGFSQLHNHFLNQYFEWEAVLAQNWPQKETSK